MTPGDHSVELDRCSVCGTDVPKPVELHHSEADCQAAQERMAQERERLSEVAQARRREIVTAHARSHDLLDQFGVSRFDPPLDVDTARPRRELPLDERIGRLRDLWQTPADESIIVRAARELSDAIGAAVDAADVVAAARVLLEEEYSGKDVERILLPHGIANGALVRHLTETLMASGRPVRGALLPENAVILTPDELQAMLDRAVRGWFNDCAVAS